LEQAYFIITVMDTVLLNPLITRIGQFLRLFREKTGKNQSDIANQAGISVSMLSQIERGIVSPSIDTLFAVCAALDVEPADLFKNLSTERRVRIHRRGERLTMESGGVSYEQLMTCSQGPSQLEMSLLEIKPGAETVMSTEGHEGIETGYALEGAAVLIIDGTEYSISEGDSFFSIPDSPINYETQGRKHSERCSASHRLMLTT
jgi:transcriptional regulator with XRE-family HTH domain